MKLGLIHPSHDKSRILAISGSSQQPCSRLRGTAVLQANLQAPHPPGLPRHTSERRAGIRRAVRHRRPETRQINSGGTERNHPPSQKSPGYRNIVSTARQPQPRVFITLARSSSQAQATPLAPPTASNLKGTSSFSITHHQTYTYKVITMSYPESHYLSPVWRDGLFSKYSDNERARRDALTMSYSQTARSPSSPAATVPSAACRPGRSSAWAPTPASLVATWKRQTRRPRILPRCVLVPR